MRGKLCLAFPDTYTLGMSHHGLQVLYTHHEQRPAMGLRAGLHALARFRGELARARLAALQPGDLHAAARVRPDRLQPAVRGLLHQHPDDARPGRHSAAQQGPHAGSSAGHRRRPGAQNPEVLAPFVDMFVIGDGEESLPWLMDTLDVA